MNCLQCLACPVSLVPGTALCILPSAVARGPMMMCRAIAVSLAFLLAPMAAHGQDETALSEDYRLACEGGNLNGCVLLGVMYANGEGVTQDHVRAVQLIRQACEGGNLYGCVLLGVMYADGQGVTQDDVRAVQLYRQACEGGSARGCANLGFMYDTGRGVTQDYVRAVQLYRQACEGGNSQGCANLGIMYYNGQGVIQDYVRAHALSNIAASQGEEAARSYRDIIARNMTPQQIAEAQALARRCTETGIAECLR